MNEPVNEPGSKQDKPQDTTKPEPTKPEPLPREDLTDEELEYVVGGIGGRFEVVAPWERG